ncbi:myelin basic protein-like [Sinocyclocheilus grahami]|uniref:myelin basic protein-like n=1 Tax=Sinocyclocheilus grahami TaxID=75366 RepID=UPI0007AD0F56|nr:PREDICTED: myelin basic protein-like [Sinocyclocheilus grahami]
MGQHLGKHELSVPKESSTVSERILTDSPESQDEVFGQGEADLNQNNGCSSKSPVVTDSMNAAVDLSSWNHPNTADPNASGHMLVTYQLRP